MINYPKSELERDDKKNACAFVCVCVMMMLVMMMMMMMTTTMTMRMMTMTTTTIKYDDGDDAHDDAYDDDAVMLMMMMINAMAYWHKGIMVNPHVGNQSITAVAECYNHVIN